MNEEQEKALCEVMLTMHNNGCESGIEIMDLAKQIHKSPKCTFIPLYRSCLVMIPSDDEYCRMIAYHDPHWMGEERNMQTIRQFKQVYLIRGQRDGPDIIRIWEGGYVCSNDVGELQTEKYHKSMTEGRKAFNRIKWVHNHHLGFIWRNPIYNLYSKWKMKRIRKEMIEERKLKKKVEVKAIWYDD